MTNSKSTAHKLPINMLLLHVIKTCNSNCIMCDCWQADASIKLSIAQILNSCKAFAGAGGKMVMVSGGEPLLRKDIGEILKEIQSLGLEVALNTNALILKKRFEDIKKYSDYIVISVDSIDSKIYKKLRGVDGIKTVLEAIEYIKQNSTIPVQLRCTLSRINLECFFDIVEYAEQNNVLVSFSVIDYDSVSFGRKDVSQQNFEKFIPTAEEIKCFEDKIQGNLGKRVQEAYYNGIITWDTNNFLAAVKFFKFHRGLPVEQTNDLCFFPYTSILVDYDGAVRPCFYAPAFSSSESVTSEILSDINRINGISSTCKCLGCRGHVFT